MRDGSRVLTDAVVVVEGDRITRVMSGADALPTGRELIDLRRYTALPGLIDLHTRMTWQMSSPWRRIHCRGSFALFTGVRWVMKDGKVVVDER